MWDVDGQSMTSPRTIGVFAGGGVRGIALAGAAAAALEMGVSFDTVVGTSAGAMVGSLVAAGHQAADLRHGVGELPWPELADPMPGGTLPLIGKHVSLVRGQALYRGRRLEREWRAMLRDKGVNRFSDLPDGALKMVATDITHQRGIVLPDDLPSYGVLAEHFSVARAVRMSAAVPFVFRPVPIRNLRTGDTALIVDGALAANFPLRCVEPKVSDRVIGFRLVDSGESHVHLPVNGPASLARAVIGAGIRAADSLPMPVPSTATIVDIPAGGDPLDFGISRREALDLFDAGWTATMRALSPRPVPDRLDAQPA